MCFSLARLETTGASVVIQLPARLQGLFRSFWFCCSIHTRVSYRGYRFPEEIISHCVWLYFNFAVSLREVELMMAYRGVQLSYETIRRWCDTFGASYAARLKRKRPKLGDKWFLDEVFLKINGTQHCLWRAVDQQGTVIDILVQPKRDRLAAIRFFRKLLRTTGQPP